MPRLPSPLEDELIKRFLPLLSLTFKILEIVIRAGLAPHGETIENQAFDHHLTSLSSKGLLSALRELRKP